jgi:hypothetical protein
MLTRLGENSISVRGKTTPRDIEILAALDCCPLTALQLLKLSQTFEHPFTTERLVRARLQILSECGRVRRSQYATAGHGTQNYYTLARTGYQLLHGPDAVPPTKRYFAPIGFSREPHTRALADFIVHTAVAAHHANVAFTGFARENTFWLRVGDDTLFPDGAFQLVVGDREFSFFVELDNSGQRIRSDSTDAESWERKIRLYEAVQDQCDMRFRVLVISTRSEQRLSHILQRASQVARNPQRSLVYGICLSDFLNQPRALTRRCFQNHRGERVALVTHYDQEQRSPVIMPAAQAIAS